MSHQRRWLSHVAPVLLASVAVSGSAYGQLFEFTDDFGKPYYEQRNAFEERIETERHDFTQSAVTVGRGILQVEGGYTYFYKETDEETESSHTTPEVLLRIGLSEDIEFRLRWNHAWSFIQDEEDESGWEDMRYALKLQLTRPECKGLLPTTAVEIRGTAPTGGEDFSTENAEVGVDFIYQWELREGMTLAGSTGYGTNGFGDFGLIPEEPAGNSFNVWTQSAVLGVELSEVNTAYFEWFGIYSDGLDDEYTISVFNIGIDHYVTDDFVIDFRAGVGLSGDSDDFFTGVGGGYRF